MQDQHEVRNERLPDTQAPAAVCEHRGHNAARCWKLHPDLIPTCHICGMKGHLQRKCPSRWGDAIEQPSVKTYTADLGQSDDLFDGLPPISL